ncbi:MAG: hypothetical protein A3G32_06330 [Deltaproteobacteria bacterium RIFCSPLOWO2_12_FULL_40_28]|nr:MAG: hypothetical protein A3C45_02425 [Deltaproteobacteria bacterium RIFCSPHIGHO2_02_FULL_40_28]OGQ19069.1 MAG: hypothetical protein A3E27_05515 [Deltaproteobacteria bacterium RIFCSPHIGHO2_12_FULL_40_32]OGQ40241.1 MAG: hypothetical protein A3I69_00955 [Deltaproteobacteria bacterium RIFCSPLOWO2_02_FULL_40_36]OGQ53512.1 MAG: hypothetical protein A3G32_06330 [Deltaproteobacteria bacterium RIFCSPLOWO2_12_FULL_40_28]
MKKKFPIMILAAGFGKRLHPLTQQIPKPLIPVLGLPILGYTLALLKHHKFNHVVINVHHLGNQIMEAIGDGTRFGIEVTYSVEEKILGTAGGLKKALHLLEDPFLVINGDIITDIDLPELLENHHHLKSQATLAVKPHHQGDESFGQLEIDAQNHILSFLNPASKETRKAFFTGVHVVNQSILTSTPKDAELCIVRDTYIPLTNQKAKLMAFWQEGFWSDLGTPDRLHETERQLEKNPKALSYQKEIDFIKTHW